MIILFFTLYFRHHVKSISVNEVMVSVKSGFRTFLLKKTFTVASSKNNETFPYYHRSIELHTIPYIGDIKLNKLTGRDIQKLYKDLQENGRIRKEQKGKKPGLSNSRVRGIHMMLHNALDRAVKERLILRNPTEDCIIPKIQKQEMQILHPEDIPLSRGGSKLCKFCSFTSTSGCVALFLMPDAGFILMLTHPVCFGNLFGLPTSGLAF